MLKLLCLLCTIALSLADGMCGDAPDQAVWNTKGEAHFAADMSTCGRQCVGTNSCVTECIVKAEGYSAACSGCFGNLASCTASKCWFKCITGASASCKACTVKNCVPAFETCSGLTPPSASTGVIAVTEMVASKKSEKNGISGCSSLWRFDRPGHLDLQGQGCF